MNMKIDLDEIVLTKVSEKDLRFLYNHLKDRDPIAYISHKSMPSYREHVEFVLSKPYSSLPFISNVKLFLSDFSLTLISQVNLDIIYIIFIIFK